LHCTIAGSGKTYTMGTSANSSHKQAVIPTVIAKVFKHAADNRAKYDVSLKVRWGPSGVAHPLMQLYSSQLPV
jgi:hypothetical protein